MQDWLLRRVEVIDTFCDVKGKLLPVVPGHFNLHVMKEAPQRAPGAVFEDDAEVGLPGAGPEEENNVWMADDLHHCALILELLQFVLFNDFSFDLFDCDDGVLPATAIDDAVAAFRQLPIVAQLIKWNFVVLNESARLVRDVIVAAILLLL